MREARRNEFAVDEWFLGGSEVVLDLKYDGKSIGKEVNVTQKVQPSDVAHVLYFIPVV